MRFTSLSVSQCKPSKIYVAVLSACLGFSISGISTNTFAGDLNTAIPVTINIPAQPLAEALKQYAKQSGKNIVFDNSLAKGKLAPAVKGNYDEGQALKKILENSGLEASVEDNTIVVKREREKLEKSENIQLDKIEVRAKRFYEIGPLPGLGLTKEQIPGNVQSITAQEIKESHSLSITDLMNKKLQSVTVNDYQGNPFQMDVQYRGFTAGPQIGTPQGLSVFFDGIRVNEPFGDVVNWDMIPMNALAGVDVFPGSNPIFGLNTLGGAFTLKTKDGFNNTGVDAEVLTGSFGRKQFQVEGGVNNGTFALFGAGNFFLEDGWRKNSPSEVNQFFGKASYRGDKLDLNLSTLIVGTDLVGNGLLPSEMYAAKRNDSFTSEDATKNRLQQFQLSGAFQVNDTFSVTGQVYRRDSKRHQTGADVFTDWPEMRAARRFPENGEEFTCLFKSTANPTDGSNPNLYGMPDYVLISTNLTQGEDFFSGEFIQDYFNNNGVVDLDVKYAANVNAALPQYFVDAFNEFFNSTKNLYAAQILNRDFDYINQPTGPALSYTNGEVSYSVNPGIFSDFNQLRNPSFPGENVYVVAGIDTFYYEQLANGDVVKNYVVIKPAINIDTCQPPSSLENTSQDFPGPYNIREPGAQFPTLIDGAYVGQPGYVPGTPTAVITDNNINQIVDGASVQLNWNFEKHKFMVGASIDAAKASYTNEQRFGMLDASRYAFLAPELIHPQFTAATLPLNNNDFSGTNTTKSLYFSETWTPTEKWNFNVSGRYNETQAQNQIATRYGFFAYGLGNVLNFPFGHDTCTSDEDCENTPTNFRPPIKYGNLDEAETEKFSYYSFNPSIGATWQAKENLNIYANIAKGARTPSVVELGCANDKRPSGVFYADGNGGTYEVPKSVLENRQCYLPNTLSGDPYLPQIKSTSYDIGLRGTVGEHMQWNLGAYQTDLKDDIYFVAVGDGMGFFDSIGKTRRRGIEAGLSGKVNKWGFGVNYSLTDATFEDSFLMISEDNNSSVSIPKIGINVIKVDPGSRMPGVALHNLNASFSYDVTEDWTVGMSVVAHSGSYARGNENNKHRVGVTQYRSITVPDGNGSFQDITVARQVSNNPGVLPGYATFNFQTSYKFNKEWTASLFVNNLFDKEYFSAGRLGRNPFSPSINGAIGPSGYNHNSADWLSTNFIAPGAPRGVWFSFNWQFDPNAKPSF
ncbi:MAG: TonB-dependent receptor [Methylophilus sp.]|nr:TonB-dependent receptor [Methylophilus sp.]